jgi:hypothetical protein
VKFPGRSQQADSDGVSWGREVTADNPRAGHIDDGSVAWPERILEAERQWPRANAQDFERIGKLYRDKASGLEYKRVSGAPLLSIGTPATDGISCFIVVDGRMTSCAGPTGRKHGSYTTGRSSPVPAVQRPRIGNLLTTREDSDEQQPARRLRRR